MLTVLIILQSAGVLKEVPHPLGSCCGGDDMVVSCERVRSQLVETSPVLITGATGLLGNWLIECAAGRVELVAVTHRRPIVRVSSVTADLRDLERTTSVFRAVNPRLVIHAAYAKDRSSIVDATRHVAAAAAAIDAPVLFISSDAVFEGDGSARVERSTPDARWDYGRWKAEAERAVVQYSPDNAVVRLPLLVSIDPDDHVVTDIRTEAAAGAITHWYADEIRQPAWASEVASAIWQIAGLAEQQRSGYWHLAGPHSLSRFAIAQLIVERLGLPALSIQSSKQPPGSDRPTDIRIDDARAKSQINWLPSSIG